MAKYMVYQKPEDWLTKNIKIAEISEFSIEATGSKATKVKDENGDDYTIWHNVKDGSFSKAYSKFQGTRIGDVIEINYEEKPAKNPQFTNRTVRTVKKIGGGVRPGPGGPTVNPNGTVSGAKTIDEYEDAEPVPF